VLIKLCCCIIIIIINTLLLLMHTCLYFTCFHFMTYYLFLVPTTERSRDGNHVTCQLERPVQSRHVLFPPMAARLLLTNSRQSSSGRSTSPRQHNIIIYHDKHLVLLFINSNHSNIPPPSFIRDPLLHHGLPFPAIFITFHP
jgi:hypothetical protein